MRRGRPEEYAMLMRQILYDRMLNGENIRLHGAIPSRRSKPAAYQPSAAPTREPERVRR